MRALGAAALALVAAGCASVDSDPTPIEVVAVESAPSPIAGRDWHLSRYDGESSLAYGVAETDDVSIALGCVDGSGRVVLFRDAPDGAPREFHLESGRDTGRFSADSEPSMLSDGQILSAEVAADEAVFRRFRSVGWLAVWTGDEREAYAPQPGSEANAERFFAACG